MPLLVTAFVDSNIVLLRMLDELAAIRDDMERQKRDTESFFRNQLQTMQHKYTRELQKHMQTGSSVANKNVVNTE